MVGLCHILCFGGAVTGKSVFIQECVELSDSLNLSMSVTKSKSNILAYM